MARSSRVLPFVGRTGELAVLAERAVQARQGQPRVVLMEGEAGFGKSALLTHFLDRLDNACVLRASGEEAETLLAYGVIAQLAGSAGSGGWPVLRISPQADPLRAGADLAALIGQIQGAGKLAVIAVDDLHWADSRSATALMFALRRMQGDRALGLMTARPGELGRLGEGWSRFISGDYRASRVRLGGLAATEIAALGRALGTAEVSARAASRLRDHTGGSPLYCRALLEEAGPQEWEGDRGGPPAPRGLTGIILARVQGLGQPAQQMVQAAAVLGRSASLSAAAALAGLADPVHALDEAVRAGLVRQEQAADSNRVTFDHPLVHRAVYDSLGPALRRHLHQRAADLLDPVEALTHRFAAMVGPEAGLAADLESTGQRALAEGRPDQAAAWLAKAAAACPLPDRRDRLLLDALETLVGCGDVAGAEALTTQAGRIPAGARGNAILGHLDLLAGRAHSAEARLTQAWDEHDHVREPLTGAQAAFQLTLCCLMSGRSAKSMTWGERAVAAAGGDEVLRQHALGALALSIASQHRGTQALARLDFLPAAPAEIPLALTDVLVNRGMVRVMIEDLPGAVADLSAAAGRLRAGLRLRYASQCLGYLAEAEYRLGDWDDAVIHSELAVSLATDAGRTWDLSFVHGFAALVPAARGDWEVAAGHVEEAGAAARAFGAGMAVTAWATARAVLGMARGDHDEVLRAVATVRATGRTGFFGGLGLYGWRPLEVGALIDSGNLAGAERALAELRVSLTAASPVSLRMAMEWLGGSLAIERGDAAGAEQAFAAAWRCAAGCALPFQLARLELADGRRLRQAGRRPEAIGRLRAARSRMAGLGARPYVGACDAELAACGVQVRADTVPEALGLTPTELAVARLVARGRSNREAAAELYVSVKAIEFHLGNIFAKLGIHSRRGLAERLGEAGLGPRSSSPEPLTGPRA
jgi:DNA-binding CsgD family transcriptional regulator